MSRTDLAAIVAANGPPAVIYAGPPADRMAGRAVARAAAAKRKQGGGNYKQKAKAKIKAKPQVTAEINASLARKNLLDHAVRAGIFNEGNRAAYEAMYDADPAGCKAFLARLGLSEGPAGSQAPPAEQPKSRVVSLD